ncbi:PREDICTED: uncharacterized protein LOC109472869 [Branchiostoma belcheri]|uniref:Uncharacterized protein LOC109472869 n=1 Tax=Branchiostoma belcheri TaxID=7741 RepID=A0A6P4ZB16_BRABE|nr:PREDICTED: uncharacterized protein LOC109472869 [Branchiostoma belcheri]XP_019628293.1 PREDICTED: uncharacterized protein LOC109472869 [Branchiostoma belcheri]XP_019628294.1 PREDICTED: uncharacterized protein LOC109472869 [Branchiostoma belcheri]
MEVKTHKRKGSQFPQNGVKKYTRFQQKKQDSLKNELATLDCTDPEKLQTFFQEYDSTPISLSSNGEIFTPWQGGTSDRARFRLSECSNLYVNPTEDLKVIGYLGHIEEDTVIMVGTQSGRVYKDKYEIVYIVADNLSEFAQHGCKKDPKFFDYYMARPDDRNSLPCAAGTVEDEEDITMDTTEEWSIDYEKLEADLVRADKLFEERGSFLSNRETADRGGRPDSCSDTQETCKVRARYDNSTSPVAVF